MKKRIVVQAFLIAILALCGCELLVEKKSNTPAPTLPAMAIITPTPSVTPSLSPTALASPTPTPSVSPTPSVTPSNTKTPTPTPTKTTTPTPTKTTTPTPTAAPSDNPLKLTANTPVSIDYNGDEKKETVSVTAKGSASTITVKNSSGKEISLTLEYTFVSAYLYKGSSGKACVLLSMDRDSDDYITSVYQIDNATFTLKKTCTITGYLLSMTGSSAKVFDYANVLGVWDANRDFALGSTFILNPSGDKLWHITGPNRQLTVQKDLPVKILKNNTYVSATLLKGTHIRMTATDAKTYLLFTLSDGRSGKLAFTISNSTILIGGKPAGEWFEGIPSIV